LGWENLVGEDGVADTDLHPSGWVKVNDQRIFAVSEGAFVNNNTVVTILSVDGNRVVVREKSK
jgi:membrane-bound serine protease (ClpP class)